MVLPKGARCRNCRSGRTISGDQCCLYILFHKRKRPWPWADPCPGWEPWEKGDRDEEAWK